MMMSKVFSALAALVFLSFTAVSFAQDAGPGAQVSSGSALVGAASPVNITVDFETDVAGTVVAFQFDVTFDGANLTPVTPNCAGFLNPGTGTSFVNVNCSMPDANTVRVVVDDSGNNPIPTTRPIVNIDFGVAGAAASTYPLTVGNETYALSAGTIAPAASSNGQIAITLGPMPDISAAPTTLANFATPVQAPQGGAAPTADLVISNSGDPATTLTGSCAYTGNPAISVSPADALASGLATGATSTVTFTCDNTSVGMFSGTYDCTGLNASSGVTLSIPVSCQVTLPGPAVFNSTPIAPSGTIDIDMIAGSQPLEMSGQTVTASNTLQNTASVGNFDVTNLSCSVGGAPFSVSTSPAGSIAPGGSTTVAVTCDSSGQAAGAFSDTLTCIYDVDGSGLPAGTTTTYPVQCDIRAAQSSVTPSPADGTTLNISVLGNGGSGTRSVAFSEGNNEGLDGSVNCSLSGVDAANFNIDSPAFPALVPAGGSVNVVVSGTEPGFTPIAASLDCTFTDTAAGTTPVSYPLGFTVRPLIVPTLSQWGMILMALGMVGFASYRLRRRTDV